MHSILSTIDDALYRMKHIYVYTMIGLHVIYFALFFGILSVDPKYLNLLNLGVQIFICVFLMVRFNPFRRTDVLKPMDKYVIFSSAVILATNLVAVEISNYIVVQKGIVPSTIQLLVDISHGTPHR
jgi:hypothetical protein